MLTSLPEELILMVFRYILLHSGIIYRDSKVEDLHPRVLRSCKKLCELGRRILYGENVFGIASIAPFYCFPGSMRLREHL